MIGGKRRWHHLRHHPHDILGLIHCEWDDPCRPADFRSLEDFGSLSGGATTITKYYQAGGQRIALRVNGAVRWLATDHLGSTAVTANETAARIAELRYKPWGENRYTFGATPTQRRLTGQVMDDAAGCISTTGCCAGKPPGNSPCEAHLTTEGAAVRPRVMVK